MGQNLVFGDIKFVSRQNIFSSDVDMNLTVVLSTISFYS